MTTAHEFFFTQSMFRPMVTAPESDLPIDVLGMDRIHEAFVSPESRDAALGVASAHVEFGRMTLPKALDGGDVVASIAVGHAIGAPGFEVIAPYVLSAVVDQALAWRADTGKIIVARVEYEFKLRNGACGRVVAVPLPLYPISIDDQEIDATMSWVQGQVSNMLSRKALA